MYFEQNYQHILAGTQTQICLPLASDQNFDPVRRAVFTGQAQVEYYIGQLVPMYPAYHHAAEPIGQIRITNIRQVRLRDLSDEDAQACGCRDMHDFVAWWMLTYGTFNRNQDVLVFDFFVQSTDEEALRRWENRGEHVA